MIILLMLISGAACFPADQPCDRVNTPEQRALAFLTREVPRWRPEHACYSCHNNGDAARALYRLRKLRHPVPDEALADTTEWLAHPERWKDNHGDERFSDKTLANIQFAAALAAAQDAGAIEDETALRRAADLLAPDQQPDGTWKIDAEGAIGSPITYGRFLTVAQCRRVFERAGQRRFAKALERTDHFLREEQPQTVLDAAGCLLGLAAADDAAADRQRWRCLEITRAAEANDGGWGPYRNAPLEPFDTAVVVLALSELPAAARPEDTMAMRARGRAWLVRTQLPNGSWPETTRPPDRDSYAHRISTTAWATLALLATAPEPRP